MVGTSWETALGREAAGSSSFGRNFSMYLLCTLSALKGIRVPQNHRWHGRLCPGILQHEETAVCLTWRFWGRKGGSADQAKAAPLALGGWGTGCLLRHGQVPKGNDISAPGKGTRICPAWEETPSHRPPNRAGQIKAGSPSRAVLFGRAVRALTPRASLLLICLMEADVV